MYSFYGQEDKEDNKKRKLDEDDVQKIKKRKKEKSELVTKLMAIYEKLRRYKTCPQECNFVISSLKITSYLIKIHSSVGVIYILLVRIRLDCLLAYYRQSN